MAYDPRANIGRFVRIDTGDDGKPVALIRNPKTGVAEPFGEMRLVRWLAVERQHNNLMPIDLKFNSAVQIGEITKALSAVQDHKRANGIPIDSPLALLFAPAANDAFFDPHERLTWAYDVLKEEIERRNRQASPQANVLSFSRE